MFDYKNRSALVTGASTGIGASFARALAARGAHLVLVARSRDKLDELGRELSGRFAVRAIAIATDLAAPGAAARIFAETSALGLAIDVLVNSAGFATYGSFESVSLARQHEEITLNVAALVETTHAFLPSMIARGEGVVINVASTAAFQPLPYMAIYGATKAFVLSFSEALWAENRARGVRILALCPGATETPFFEVVKAKEASVGRRESPDLVVSRALKAVDARRSYVISGRANCFMAQAGRLLPRATLTTVTERILRPSLPAKLP